MSASIIRVGRRKRRSNCRPRPGCPCGSSVGACIEPTVIAGFDSGEFLEVSFGVPVLIVPGADLSGLLVTFVGGPRSVDTAQPIAIETVQLNLNGPLIAGDAVLVIPDGFTGITDGSGFACPGSYPFEVGA